MGNWTPHRDADYPPLQEEFNRAGSVQWVSLSYWWSGGAVGSGRSMGGLSRRKLLYLMVRRVSLLPLRVPCTDLGWLVAGAGSRLLGRVLQANSVALVVLSVPDSRVRTALVSGAARHLAGPGPTSAVWWILRVGSVFWVNVRWASWRSSLVFPSATQPRPQPGGHDAAGFVLLAA